MFKRKKLKEFLQEEGKSASSLGRDLCVSEGAIRHILAGTKQPSLAMAAQIATMMGCTVDDLIVMEEE